MTTDKACFDIEAPRAGVVRRILADAKSTLPVGYIIALIGDPDDPLPDVSAANSRRWSGIAAGWAGRRPDRRGRNTRRRRP